MLNLDYFYVELFFIICVNMIISLLCLAFLNSFFTYSEKYSKHFNLYSLFFFVTFTSLGCWACTKNKKIYDYFFNILKNFRESFIQTRDKMKLLLDFIPTRWYTVTVFLALLLFFLLMYIGYLIIENERKNFYSVCKFSISSVFVVALFLELIVTHRFNITVFFISSIFPLLILNKRCDIKTKNSFRICLFGNLAFLWFLLCPTGILEICSIILSIIIGGIIGLWLMAVLRIGDGDAPGVVENSNGNTSPIISYERSVHNTFTDPLYGELIINKDEMKAEDEFGNKVMDLKEIDSVFVKDIDGHIYKRSGYFDD